MLEVTFAGRVIEWRGPAPYYYLPVPDEESADIREVAASASYGWGAAFAFTKASITFARNFCTCGRATRCPYVDKPHAKPGSPLAYTSAPDAGHS